MRKPRSLVKDRPVSPAQAVAEQRQQLKTLIPDATDRQLETVMSVSELTMTSPERILSLCNAVEHLATHNIAGDFVECGVWRGGSMAAAARTLMELAPAQSMTRRLWMYDTYEGMSEPTEHDVDFVGQSADVLLDEQDRMDGMSIWCRSPIDQVKTTMSETGYPAEQINFVEGKVEDTLPVQTPDEIALLRLDTDWYESTRCELEYLFPKLVEGGVLIIDDYGHWEGCRRAVDEYFEKHQVTMLLNRIDYTGRIGIKSGGNRHED
ncbi:MAG: O-methyltransferase [Mariniblastus sp.]|jgi:O-methyltransferase